MFFVDRIKTKINTITRIQHELIWANTWHDTIRGLEWAENIGSISPGRWAVGYNYVYVMTRILNEMQPHKVLDLGLGISTTLIGEYFKYFSFADGIHDVIEHDEKWIEFYTRCHALSKNTEIHRSELQDNHIDGTQYYSFAKFSELVSGKKYDVISIDAPFGGDVYSRRDLLNFMPDLLEDDFVIIVDDAERKGEQKTIKDLEMILKKHNILFEKGLYTGSKDCCVIASQKNKFLCSL